MTVAGAVQLAIPERLSPLERHRDVHVVPTGAVGAGDANAFTVGAVLSILIPDFATGALTFPALSVHVPDPDVWFEPSPVTVAGALQLSRPESASVAENVTVTSELFHPAPFAAGDAFATAVGAVRSMLIPVTVVDAEFPAASVQVPPAD